MADHIVNGLHGCSREEEYVWPKDPVILDRLEWFQDQKLALMMHFGAYSQLGICESWPLSDGDAHWSRGGIDWEKDPEVFKRQYIDLNKSFNPLRIMPDQWADIALDAGFKYLIFTTKHHDGFCMYDSQYTNYKVTDQSCPFHTHKYADIARHVFDAFREKGMGIAAYFSKPDWNCPWYWAEGQEKPFAAWRNPTYDPKKNPELWEKFVQFTQNQLLELVERYGRLEVLWLDGGQVRPQNGQDIRLHEVAERARKIQPWLLFADRTVGGEFENYITPEQSIPGQPVRVPWESCVSVGSGFAFKFGDQYKTPRRLVQMLIDTTSRGGNLALNIAPQPDGRLPIGAIRSAQGLGAWLKVNGESIYGTRICPPYMDGKFCYTRKGETSYALLPFAEGEAVQPVISIPWAGALSRVQVLGYPAPLTFERAEGIVNVQMPYAYIGSNPLALSFRIDR